MHGPTRRKFLSAAVGTAAAWGLSQSRMLLSGVAPQIASNSAPIAPIVRITRALGTQVSLTVAHHDGALADRAISLAFNELTEIEALLSIYRRDSQISLLNSSGQLSDPHPHLLTVLLASQAMSSRTNGAFDVTVQPLWDLHASAAKQRRTPQQHEIDACCRSIDYRKIEISARRVRLLGPHMAITFNGIAQGYATDRVRAVLQRHGIEHALIDVGEIGPIGEKSTGHPWTAGIQHPRVEDAYVAVIPLDGRSLATSGDYATSFTNDHRDHHIFDPSTGRSPTEFSSVSVLAPSTTDADALSTAIFVLGLGKGLRLIRETPGADALFVLKNGSLVSTRGWPATI